MTFRPLLVLLPGYDGNGTKTFAGIIPFLEKDFEVKVIDYPYRTGTAAMDLTQLADFVHGDLADLPNPEIHLAGFSMGGFVAEKYAARYPGKIASVSLISSASKPEIKGIGKIMFPLTLPISRNRRLANAFGRVYCSPKFRTLTKLLPLPAIKADFAPDSGYAVFGTLAKVLREVCHGKHVHVEGITYRSLLFEDDRSFPAGTCRAKMRDYGYEVTTLAVGGHAESDDYWEKVAIFLSAGKNLRQ